MKWTKEQFQAITERNKNILVAAAAGSGKTAVLVERIKNLILEDRCSVDNMLIVTFTNKAASEMKQRLEKAISKSIEETENEKDLIYLKGQLDLLPLANISTFHAFSLEVIHRYFYLINVEPNFKIADEIQATLLKEEAMDELLEELFSENDQFFYDFLKKHSGDRNESQFRDMIGSCYETIMALPEPLIWLRDSVERLNGPLEESSAMKTLWINVDKAFNRAKKIVEDNYDRVELLNLKGMMTLGLKDKAELLELEEAIKNRDFDNTKDKLDNFRLPSAVKSYFKDENSTEELAGIFKARRNEIKDIISDMKKYYFYDSFDNLKTQVMDTYGDALLLEAYVERFSEIYDRKKKEKGLVDFNDIEHHAFEILKNEEAAGYYREKFRHIFIDEYQDSNVIQEALIGRIKRENNLFMVGDIKQSIYKFRLAEPEIFQKRYENYKKEMAEAEASGITSNSVKIDLNQNFRSKKPVIDFINNCFEPIMEGYDEEARLYPGDPYALESSFKPKMFLTPTFWDNDEELDDELKNLQKAQKEALACVKLISESLGKPFLDSKKALDSGKESKLRQITKKDIVILLRSVKNYGDIFYKTLQENNIPAYVDDNEGYFDTIEINTFLALLNIVDNEKQDIPLITAMRSEVFGFSIEELVEIRIQHKKGTYFEAVKNMAVADQSLEGNTSIAGQSLEENTSGAGQSEEENTTSVCQSVTGVDIIALSKKCSSMFGAIGKWKSLRQSLPLEVFIWELLLETDFYILMGALPGGIQRQANLRSLVDKAASFRKSQGGSLYGFISYIDAVKKKKVSMGQVKLMGEDDDTVRIMTIHKSKGLEFPMVIVAGFNRELKYTSMGKKLAIHKDVGVGLPLVNPKDSWYRSTIIQSIIQAMTKSEEVEEQKRVLYVAMTRARDILYLLGITDDVEGTMIKALETNFKPNSYFTMTGHAMMNLRAVEEITNAELLGFHEEKHRNVGEVIELMERAPAAVSEDILTRMEYIYPHEKELHIKSKYSVSELNARNYMYESRQTATNIDSIANNNDNVKNYNTSSKGTGTIAKTKNRTSITIAEPKSRSKREGFSRAQIGTFTHMVLEKMDFVRAKDIDYLKKLREELVEKELLAKDEASTVDLEKLCGFSKSELGQRIGKASLNGKLRREQNFNLKMEVDDSISIVQGIIDCFFIEDDGIVLVDYKTTSNSNISEIKKSYEKQIDIYRSAITEATGMIVKEAYLYLTNQNKIIQM